MAPVLPIIESKGKKKPRTSSGPRRLIRWSFAATSSVRFARAADPLLSSNAQQDEDQKQTQRELHHASKVLQSRTQTLRARPGSVKAGGAGPPTRVGRRTGRSGPGQLNQRDLGRRTQGQWRVVPGAAGGVRALRRVGQEDAHVARRRPRGGRRRIGAVTRDTLTRRQ